VSLVDAAPRVIVAPVIVTCWWASSAIHAPTEDPGVR
jgi:hypothetical protein